MLNTANTIVCSEISKICNFSAIAYTVLICPLKLRQPVQQLLQIKSTISAKKQHKNRHLSWAVDRGNGWDWGMGFYLLYPIMPGLNQSSSVWFLDVWLSTSLLPFWVPQRWGSVALFCLLAPVESRRSNFHRFNSLSFWQPGGPHHHSCSSSSSTELFPPTLLWECKLIFESFDLTFMPLVLGVRREQWESTWARLWVIYIFQLSIFYLKLQINHVCFFPSSN